MDKKITDLTEIVNATDDALLYIVDTSDLSEDVTGTSKKIKKSSLIKKATALNGGDVKTDITEADPIVYTKTTVDNLLNGLAPVNEVYANVTNLFISQGSQKQNYIYEVTDADGFGTITAGKVWLRYKGTTNGDETDYEVINVPSGGYIGTVQDLEISINAVNDLIGTPVVEKKDFAGGETTWVLTGTPSTNFHIKLFAGTSSGAGMILLDEGIDFTISGNTITYLSPVLPIDADERHIIYYNESDFVSNQYENINIQLPSEISIVEGNRLEIFKASIVNAINPNNYFLNLRAISGTPKGFFYDRIYIYDCAVSDNNMTLEFSLKNEQNYLINKAEVIIKPTPKASNPVSTFNVLLIGDSFTQTPVYPNELYRRLTGTGGVPVADNLTNINFIGTNDLGDVPREGYSAQTWAFFLGSSSPFYNSSTGLIDFANYVTVNGYGSIDAVVILLGTNDISNNTEVSSFLDKLVAYNPSIKGLVTGKILPVPQGGAGTAGLINQQTFYGGYAGTFIYNRRMQELILSTYSSNFKFVDILPSFDVFHNMPHALVNANYRNSTDKVTQGTDNVHPNTVGYLQIADIIYNNFHGFIIT